MVLTRLVPLLSMLNSFTFVAKLPANLAPHSFNANTDGKFLSQYRKICLKWLTITQNYPIELLPSHARV